jgi:hypothetical protein
MSNIILNQICTPDGTTLTSYSVHDYKTHLDSNGETYMVDGGCEYLRRNLNKEKAEELSVYSDASFEEIREAFYWGTRGINMDQPLKYKTLSELETPHIQAILDTQYHVPEWRKDIFKKELDYRGIE